jgi:hypothetical protein
VNTSTPNPKLVPVPGFDPATSSDAELSAHDFPPRPTDPDLLADWRDYAALYVAGDVVSCQTPNPNDYPPELQQFLKVKGEAHPGG